jgi:hypothetical protein
MESFNDQLLEHSKEISLQEYHTKIIPKLFPTINISKSDFMIELSRIENDDFCIHQDRLTEFKLISFDNIDELKTILLKSNLIENKHFKIRFSIKEQSFILLNPLGFRTFLLNIHDTDFIDHLLMIDKIYSNYSDLQIKHREKYIESEEIKVKRKILEEFTSKLSIACNSTEIIRELISDRLLNEVSKKNNSTKTKTNHIQYKLLQHRSNEKRLVLTSTKRKTQGDYKKLITEFASDKENFNQLLQDSIEEFNQNRSLELLEGIDLNDENMTDAESQQLQEMLEIIDSDHNIKYENKNEYTLGNECILDEFLELIEKIKVD